MSEESASECSLLLLPDGRLLARNITPELSALLAMLSPDNPEMMQRSSLPEQNHFPSDSPPTP